jgi:hypothetical protein
MSEWKPSRATWVAWSVLSVPIVVAAALGYEFVALRGVFPTSVSVDVMQFALAVGLTLALAAAHEAVHGLVMRAFGASPEFGVLRADGVPLGFFATAPGHRFSRREYLIVAMAPVLVLTPLGVPACLLPFGAYLAIPLAVVCGGCVGDLTIAWRVLQVPSNIECEDLRDGVRFWQA